MAVSTIDPNGLNIGQIGGTRNLIINGAMQVAQRGTSATGVTSAGYYTCDRWDVGLSSNGTYTISQDSNAPDEFSNSFKYLCTTANTTLDSSQYVTFRQRIEGQNLQHLKFGTAKAVKLTVSFWVKSNKTGTYTLAVEPEAAGLNNGKTYTINSADTWEYKTLTFSGQTSGAAIPNNNTVGIELQWWLSAGSSFNSGTFTEDSYTGTAANRVSPDNVNLSDTVNNYWQITGVQLEVGDTATPFEHRSYGQELALCQRYYNRIVGDVINTGIANGISRSNSAGTFVMTFPQEMRVAPSLSQANLGMTDHTNYTSAVSGVEYGSISKKSLRFGLTGTAVMTNYRPASVIATSVGGYLAFDAEL